MASDDRDVSQFGHSTRERSERGVRVSAAIGTGLRRAAPSILILGGLLALWHGAVIWYDIPSIILPGPAEVASKLIEGYPTFLADAGVTALTAALGLAIGCLVGGVLAFLMTYSRTAAKTVLPYVIALRIAPLIAIAPLVFLWFGRGIPARAMLVGTLTLFPMTVATLDGLRSTPPAYLALMETVSASRLSVFWRVRVPAAAPSVFAGLKLAATLSVIGTVVAEFVTLRAGIGYRVFVTSGQLQTAEAFAALVVLSAVGIGFYLAPLCLERVVEGRTEGGQR